MRCIVVNDANLKSESYCGCCRNKIGSRYIREIGSGVLYCDYFCYQGGMATAALPSPYGVSAVSVWMLSS